MEWNKIGKFTIYLFRSCSSLHSSFPSTTEYKNSSPQSTYYVVNHLSRILKLLGNMEVSNFQQMGSGEIFGDLKKKFLVL